MHVIVGRYEEDHYMRLPGAKRKKMSEVSCSVLLIYILKLHVGQYVCFKQVSSFH